jgi:hypothetical protein
MRQSHERLLAAKGIAVGKTLPIPGLKVFLANDHSANSLLIVRGNVWGPSWPALTTQLEQSGIEHSLIEAGKAWLVVLDSSHTRSVLHESRDRAKLSAREQVMVPEVGFVSAGVKKRFEPRLIVGPAVVALVSVGLAFLPALLLKESEQADVEDTAVTCALDLPDRLLREWIVSTLDSASPNSSGELLVQSNLGLLKLETQQVIGSTQSVSGFIECQDGRQLQLHYRLDRSANGSFVELGQKLDP